MGPCLKTLGPKIRHLHKINILGKFEDTQILPCCVKRNSQENAHHKTFLTNSRQCKSRFVAKAPLLFRAFPGACASARGTPTNGQHVLQKLWLPATPQSQNVLLQFNFPYPASRSVDITTWGNTTRKRSWRWTEDLQKHRSNEHWRSPRSCTKNWYIVLQCSAINPLLHQLELPSPIQYRSILSI